jgi:hypothetical protein
MDSDALAGRAALVYGSDAGRAPGAGPCALRLTAEVTATQPHNHLTSRSATADRDEVEASELGLSLN